MPSYVSLSENYAVIDVGGTQHLVEEGRWYTCNRLNVRTPRALNPKPSALMHAPSSPFQRRGAPRYGAVWRHPAGGMVGEPARQFITAIAAI